MSFGYKTVGLTLGKILDRFPALRGAVEVSEIEVKICKLAPEFDGYRIAQFSDLHLDNSTTTRAQFEALVAQINAHQPDLIAFTGDFVTYKTEFRPADLIEPLRDLRARDGKVAVMGNHDHGANWRVLQRVMRESGMINLNNAVHTLRRGNVRLHIAGVDSLSFHQARLEHVIKQLPGAGSATAGTAILLAHEPELIEVSAATGRFALQLSGHTHGGQIRIPGITRLALGRKQHYPIGAYQVGNTLLYVNRGIGMVGLPLRFNCPPELTMITLRSGEESGCAAEGLNPQCPTLALGLAKRATHATFGCLRGRKKTAS